MENEGGDFNIPFLKLSLASETGTYFHAVNCDNILMIVFLDTERFYGVYKAKPNKSMLENDNQRKLNN